MATFEEVRQQALAQMAANAGAGRVGADPRNYNDVVSPAIQGGMGARATSTATGWADRNAIVAKAASQMLGGVGSALNSVRQQDENEWLRKYREAQAKKGGSGGGGRGGGGGGSSDSSVTMPTVASGGEWDWLDEYLNRPNAPAPTVNRAAPVPTSGAGMGRGGTMPKPKPTKPTLPKVVRY